ncbi:MAG: hypothetical protein KF780_04480 [Sphingomonas sp.]|nr:hypothetical protein [Sphingomonas sp.]
MSRVLLGTVFLTGIGLDPAQPVHHAGIAYSLLLGYLLLASFCLAVTWSDWRLETRLALPALIVDLALFTALAFLTQGYANPYFPFFAFIILSAALRWGWRETAATAAVLITLFVSASLAGVLWEAAELDPRRFFYRTTFLLVLSFVLVWFGLNQLRPKMPRLDQGQPADPSRAADPPIRAAADFVAANTSAGRVVIAWWNYEEPWTNVAVLDETGFAEHRHDPGRFGLLVDRRWARAPFLFDFDRRRLLLREGRSRRVEVLDGVIDEDFARAYLSGRGIVVPVESGGYGGIIFAIGMPGLCSDDVAKGESLGEEVSAAFERAGAMALLADAASTRTRLSFSRDLHDSVLQLLAGTSYRLEGVKKSARAGQAIEAEIDALQDDLVAEQREMRMLIGQLRGCPPGAATDLRQSLKELAARMSRQWDVNCSVDHCSSEIETPVPVERECRQLVREAVANAVRHGRASSVAIEVEAVADTIRLVLTDNGSGFPGDGHFAMDRHGKVPWSLSERVRALGGHMSLASGNTGSQITISLPLGRAA